MQRMEHDDMTGKKPSPRRPKKDERQPPRDSRGDEPVSEPGLPPFLNDGPELVRDSHC
ncbi:hypothetical protein [Bradyrhizobium sp.]|uniref:hypothetical protein n=1 Tax=Bradyrhizobium sp. TaxID=376 RepID=UPI00403805EE